MFSRFFGRPAGGSGEREDLDDLEDDRAPSADDATAAFPQSQHALPAAAMHGDPDLEAASLIDMAVQRPGNPAAAAAATAPRARGVVDTDRLNTALSQAPGTPGRPGRYKAQDAPKTPTHTHASLRHAHATHRLPCVMPSSGVTVGPESRISRGGHLLVDDDGADRPAQGGAAAGAARGQAPQSKVGVPLHPPSVTCHDHIPTPLHPCPSWVASGPPHACSARIVSNPGPTTRGGRSCQSQHCWAPTAHQVASAFALVQTHPSTASRGAAAASDQGHGGE